MEIQLIKGDITTIEVDAMVNAANSALQGGAGVNGAIQKAGGPAIMKECDEIRRKHDGCPTGQAVMTNAGNLPARKVIHAVGPIWRGGHEKEAELLGNAYYNSLKLAEQHELAIVSFPSISTGIYGFPLKKAARIAIDTVNTFKTHSKTIKRVIFVCYDYETFELYRSLLNEAND